MMNRTLYRLAGVPLAALLFVFSAGAAELPRKVTAIEGVTEYRLDNGLRLLTLPDPSADTVTVHITYLVGSRHEGYGEKGMAHLLEHMLFKGSTRHPDVKEEFARRGARWNGTTSDDRTNYFETLSAGDDNLDWALGMEADRMVNAFIAKADLDSEMTVVRNEFEMGENSPGSVLFQRMKRLAFAWHNYGNAVIGARSDIESVPIDRLRAFYRTWYQPDNAVLIIAGRFDEARALELVAKHFGALPRPQRPGPPRLYTVEPTQDGERSVTLRRTGDTRMLFALYRLPAASHPDYPALDVLVQTLGHVPSGRLHKALVQKGLASWVTAGERAMHDPGYAYFGAGLPADASLETVREALFGVVEGVAREPVQDEEIERARTSLLNHFEKAQIDTALLVRSLSEFSAAGDWRLFFVYRDRLRKVSVADLQRVAAHYLKSSNRVTGTFLPTDKPERAEIPDAPPIESALADYAGAERVELGEAFDASPQNIEARLVRATLGNALRIELLPKRTRGARVRANLGLHWGDASSRMNRSTACMLAGEMLMRGTARRSRAELRDEFDRLNASVSIGTDGASIDVRGDRLPETLRLVAEVLREPSFPPSEFEELKRSSLTQAEAERSDPSTLASVRLARHLNPYPEGHPHYTQSIEERIAELKKVELQDAVACYRELFGATDAEFVAVGDFDPAAVRAQVEALFVPWKSPKPFKRVPVEHFDAPPMTREVLTPDKANAVLRGGLNIRMRDDDADFPAMVLANWLLGGSSTARVPARVREKEGLSYSTYTSFSASSFDRSASFAVSAIFAPENRKRVERAILEEIERAAREGFREEEVASGKAGLLEARRLSRTQDRALVNRLSLYAFRGRTFAWDVEFERRIASLTAAEVSAALRRYVDVAKLSLVVAGDFR